MTSQVKRTLRATFILCILAKIFTTEEHYVYYTIDGDRRSCRAYLNCEPGNEILPCAIQFTKDVCTSCKNDEVQPDLISSSPTGNQNDTKCFPRVKKCDANEIKYSKSKKIPFCDQLIGCECDTTKCYYGDPCLCDDKQTECEEGKYLNKTGGCEDCPEGTEKAGKGCGPCRRTKYIPERIHSRDSNSVPEVKMSSKRTETQSTKLSVLLSTSSQLPIVKHQQENIEDSDNTTMIIIIVVLGIAVVVLFIVVVYIVRTREQCMCRFNMCFNHGHTPREQIPLNQVEDGNQLENGDIQEIVDTRTTEGGRPTATPTDNRNSEIYRDQASSNQCEYQKDNFNTNTSEQCNNNNSVSRSSNLPYVESGTRKCTSLHNECNIGPADQSLASGRYITMKS
ncbi:uncharacterized protein [Mytilus edulis]|uniref:uncharacterized protein n=1 Tax=Mytilus edulis TaxID=6550 RepID=UPI0039F0AA0E